MQYFRGATAVEYIALRVDQGEDVLQSVQRTVQDCQLVAGAIVTGCGTLEYASLEVPANLAWPPTVYATNHNGPAQIMSAQGHIINGEAELYLTIARRNEMHAGKAMAGTKALYGVEFTILRAGNTRWTRVPHPQTQAPVLQAVSANPTAQIMLMGRPVDPAAIALVPRNILQKHSCLPVVKSADTLVVAMVDPNNPFAIDDLRAATGLRIQTVAVLPQELMPVLQQVLAPGRG